MAIVKMNRVKHLGKALDYSLQDYKTKSSLISTNIVAPEDIEIDFKRTLEMYNRANGTNKEMFARMIYHSFSEEDNITPQTAHEIGLKLAEEYLGDKHSFIVITHEDTDKLHNHIIFNSIEHDSLRMFNSKTKHTKHDLRRINDKLCMEYNLSIPNVTKNKGMTFNEYVVRAKNKSFKSKLETVIDETIKRSDSFDDFLEKMDQQGYSYKEGKHLAFLNQKSNRYMRTKTLGFNYLESSIKYRISHKEYVPIKRNIIDKQWIDRNDKKFKNNKGLQRWASKQNINYLNEISNKLYKENISLEELGMLEFKQASLVDIFEKKLLEVDDNIFKLEKMKNCFSVYRNSYNLISEYKKSSDKSAYKKSHYSEFKAYDMAKKDINYLKKNHSILNDFELESFINSLKEDRDNLYKDLNREQQNKERSKEKRSEKERDKGVDLS
ncbi:relaxase/mobilization nuclease domain-containing protein [Enterococcus faecium]|uniref:relaxase/mobilization nuclease domain-containing protein n=1 Tax=Enterococcus faecium TaxID=1352 RepID=UPI001020E89C|nr:relaxase/mobilization nuclease domain-containing protein [Enterococcus faecium]RYK14689.1 relaxase [Enterococcus faecium]RYK34564.1 relaxase [Enterococcus faecium]RYK65338.1 relaxase [Enterococcus faecium]